MMDSVELDTKARRVHAQRIAATLYDGTDSGDAPVQDEGHPGHALVADHADLERPAFVDRREQGNKAVDGKVDMPDRFSGLVEYLPLLASNLIAHWAPEKQRPEDSGRFYLTFSERLSSPLRGSGLRTPPR